MIEDIHIVQLKQVISHHFEMLIIPLKILEFQIYCA